MVLERDPYLAAIRGRLLSQRLIGGDSLGSGGERGFSYQRSGLYGRHGGAAAATTCPHGAAAAIGRMFYPPASSMRASLPSLS